MLFVKDPKRSGRAAKGSGGGPVEPGGRLPEPDGPQSEPDGQPPMPDAPPAAESPPPSAESPPPSAPAPDQPESIVALPLGDLAGRLGKVEEQLAEYHRRAAHREAVIDRLHEENQRLSEGLGRAFLEPVIADLIRLYDQLNREVRRLEASGQDGKLLGSFAGDVVQILDRCGVDAFTAEPGDPLERGRHRALAVVACDDESRHNTVAEVVTTGFLDRETGRIRRPVQARVFQYSAGPGAAGQAPSTARSL